MAKKNAGIKKLLKQWGKTEARTGGIVPDGSYEIKITLAEATEKNDVLKVHWVGTVSEGDKYEGKKIHKWATIVTEQNLEFLKGDLATLGLDIPDDISSVKALHKLVKESIGKLVEVRVVTKSGDKGDYTNVYFNQLLDGEDDEDEADDEEDEDEDEDEEEDDDDDDEDDD